MNRSAAQERTLAVVMVMLGGALALLASAPTWITASVRDEGLPEVIAHSNGRTVAPLVAAAGLLALAGGVAALLAGVWARRAIGFLLLLVGAAAAWTVLDVLSDPKASVAGTLGDAVGLSQVDVATATTSAWPIVAVLGCTLIALGGAWILVRAGQWSGGGRRFDRAGAEALAVDASVSAEAAGTAADGADPSPPGATGPADPEDAMGLWDALDRGEDPTA